MEPPTKRPRLFDALQGGFEPGFSYQQLHYETPDIELEDYEVEEDNEPVYDPDEELQQRRAQLDYKLKSTFEAIFTKYGKDFDGIGDEIDLTTGEILVDNGHILDMQDERDVGDSGHARSIPGSVTDEEDMGSSVEDGGDVEDEDDEEEDDEDDDEDVPSDEEMIEDDLILQGFAQASQFMHRQASPELGACNDRFLEDAEEPQRRAISRSSLHATVLPSRSDILTQFGPQLGPEIANYVSDRGGLADTSIEPAWRLPAVAPTAHTASSTPNRRPTIRSVILEPDIGRERSRSPDDAPSVWARTKRNAPRKRFTVKEDKLLLDFVVKAREKGLDFSSHLTWRQVEAMNPRHSWISWKMRYRNKFVGTWSGHLDESELSTSETSASTQMQDQTKTNHDFRPSFANRALLHSPPSMHVGRPSRIRRPMQREGILNWPDAVASIASVDPIGHAGLLEDARWTTDYPLNEQHPISSVLPNGRHSQDRPASKQRVKQHPDEINSVRRQRLQSNILRSGDDDELRFYGSKFHEKDASKEKAPCPHVNCRLYPFRLYMLVRENHEDLSPMISHLLRVHNTTPFPCGELNCERKGPQGYFTQKELVKHVKKNHPYVAALHRLRGRVDSVLLDQKIDLEHPVASIEDRPHWNRYARTRNSVFPSSRNPSHSHVYQRNQMVSWGFDPDPTVALTPSAASDSISSMRVTPPSSTARDVPSRKPSEELAYDSDIQFVDACSFMNGGDSKSQRRIYSSPLKDAVDSEETFSSLRVAADQSIAHNFKMGKYAHSSCVKMVSTNDPNPTESHLKLRDRDRAKWPTDTKPLPSPKIPNSQSSWSEIPCNGSLPISRAEPCSSAPSGTFVRHNVDRSYEFSDEEGGIETVARIPRQPSTLLDETPLPVSKPSLDTADKEDGTETAVEGPRQPSTLLNETPVPAFNSSFDPPDDDAGTETAAEGLCQLSTLLIETPVPTIKPSFNPPDSNASTKMDVKRPLQSSTLLNKAPEVVLKPSFAAPFATVMSRKSVSRQVTESEDIDELSLGTDDLVLISSRPRSTQQPKHAKPLSVKLEKSGSPGGLVPSIEKRRYSKLEDNDEIDELGADAPPLLASSQLRTIPRPRSRVNKETNKSDIPSMSFSPMNASKLGRNKKVIDGDDVNSCSSSQSGVPLHHTPTRGGRKSSGANTSFIDLVKGSKSDQKDFSGSAVEVSIPATSEIGSSSPDLLEGRTPSTSSPLAALLTPVHAAKYWPGMLVKQESEDDGGEPTPGGTMRRCREDGFACGGAFCFRCGSTYKAAS